MEDSKKVGNVYKVELKSNRKRGNSWRAENKNDQFDEYDGTFDYDELTGQVVIEWYQDDLPDEWEAIEEQIRIGAK